MSVHKCGSKVGNDLGERLQERDDDGREHIGDVVEERLNTLDDQDRRRLELVESRVSRVQAEGGREVGG